MFLKNRQTCLCIFLFSIFLSNPIFTQDLIERTRLGITQEDSRTNTTPNELAKLIQSTNRSSNSEINLFEVGEQSRSRYAQYVDDGVLLELQRTALSNFWTSKPSTITLKIPVTEIADIELELVKVDLFTDDFVLTTSDGRSIPLGDQEGVFYRGIIKGDNQSFASVSVSRRGIRILAGDDTGNYVLGEMQEERTHILYNDLKLVESNPFTCGADALSRPTRGLQNIPERNHSRNSMTNCVPVYVECDFQTYMDIGGGTDVQAVKDYVAGLLIDVATLYTNEMIDISLSEVFVWTSADPERNLNSTSDVLEAFGERKKNDYNGRLAHWISTRDLGGGVAWLDVLCDSYFTFMADLGDGNRLHHAGPYAVSAGFSPNYNAFPNFSWDVEVFTHEMGHNLGSPHTQACVWTVNNVANTAIDGCVNTETTDGNTCTRPTPSCPTDKGTIMSYCHLLDGCGIVFSNGFGPQPGNLIRNNVNNASCTLSCVPPTCDDGIQNGDETGRDCGGSSCAPCPCFESPVTLTIKFDNFPSESSWELTNAADEIVHSGGTYGNQANGSTLVINNLALAEADGYTFTFKDSFGDGICCGEGDGEFTLSDNTGTEIFKGGDFSTTASKTFCIGMAATEDCPATETISGNVSSTTLEAANSITTTGTVNITGSVTFQAGDFILLSPGFSVAANNEFLATIDDCTMALRNEPDSNLVFAKAITNTNLSLKDMEVELAVYPNPASGFTNIAYQLAEAATVNIGVFNVNGQQVAQLINQQRQEAGPYQFQYNTKQLDQGMFYIILTTKDVVTSSKLVIID